MTGVVDRIVSKFGTQAELASALGLRSQSTISKWKHRSGDQIPADWQREILAAAKDRGVRLEPADFFPSEAA